MWRHRIDILISSLLWLRKLCTGNGQAADAADRRCSCCEVTPLRLRSNLWAHGLQKTCELRRGIELRYRLEFFEC